MKIQEKFEGLLAENRAVWNNRKKKRNTRVVSSLKGDINITVSENSIEKQVFNWINSMLHFEELLYWDVPYPNGCIFKRLCVYWVLKSHRGTDTYFKILPRIFGVRESWWENKTLSLLM